MKRLLLSSLILTVSISAILGLQIVSAQTFPSTNPPQGNIVPTFSGINVDKDVTVGGFLKVGNNIKPKSGISLGLDGHVNVTQGLDVTPYIHSGITDSALVVKGVFDAQASVTNTVGSSILFSKPVEITGGYLQSSGGTLYMNDDVQVKGKISNQDATALSFNDTDGVNFAGNTYKSTIVQFESGSSVSGNMALQNKIRAQSFGDIDRNYSLYETLSDVPASPSKLPSTKSVTCPKKSIILSCTGHIFAVSDTLNTWGKDAVFFNTDVLNSGSSTDTPTCIIYASPTKNLTKPVGLSFRAEALCFDPNKFDTGSNK